MNPPRLTEAQLRAHPAYALALKDAIIAAAAHALSVLTLEQVEAAERGSWNAAAAIQRELRAMLRAAEARQGGQGCR